MLAGGGIAAQQRESAKGILDGIAQRVVDLDLLDLGLGGSSGIRTCERVGKCRRFACQLDNINLLVGFALIESAGGEGLQHLDGFGLATCG